LRPEIPLVTDTGSGMYKKLFLKLNPAHICSDYPTPNEQAKHMGKCLVQPYFHEVKRGLSSASGDEFH